VEKAGHAPSDIGAEARRLYEATIRAKVEPGNHGKYLVIDVQTGEYEVDADDMTAMKRASAKNPNGTFHLMRIGHRTVGRIGARQESREA
jgi:hypothetical protein